MNKKHLKALVYLLIILQPVMMFFFFSEMTHNQKKAWQGVGIVVGIPIVMSLALLAAQKANRAK